MHASNDISCNTKQVREYEEESYKLDTKEQLREIKQGPSEGSNQEIKRENQDYSRGQYTTN